MWFSIPCFSWECSLTRSWGLRSSFFIEMPDLDTITKLAPQTGFSDLGSTDSHCKELGLTAKLDTSSEELLMAQSLPRVSSLQKRCHLALKATLGLFHLCSGISHGGTPSWPNPAWLTPHPKDRSRHPQNEVCLPKHGRPLGWDDSHLRGSQWCMERAQEEKLSVVVRWISLWTSPLAMMGHWHRGTMYTSILQSSSCFSEGQKQMLPILLGLGFGRKGVEEQNVPWRMKKMENEIEQTAERLTAGACWIYCYWL